MTHENEQHEQLPENLVAELKARDRHEPLITARVDRELAELAARQFETRPSLWQRPPAWAAMAASVLVALFLFQADLSQPVSERPLYADVDQSGRIDIADVLAAARSRSDDDASQAELDAFARQIVSLSRRDESS